MVEETNNRLVNTAVGRAVERLFGLLIGLFITLLLAVVVTEERGEALSSRVQCALWGILGALLSYNYAVLGLPGTAFMVSLGAWAGLVTAVVGGLLGLAAQRMWVKQVKV